MPTASPRYRHGTATVPPPVKLSTCSRQPSLCGCGSTHLEYTPPTDVVIFAANSLSTFRRQSKRFFIQAIVSWAWRHLTTSSMVLAVHGCTTEATIKIYWLIDWEWIKSESDFGWVQILVSVAISSSLNDIVRNSLYRFSPSFALWYVVRLVFLTKTGSRYPTLEVCGSILAVFRLWSPLSAYRKNSLY